MVRCAFPYVRQRLRELRLRQGELATMMQMSPASISLKLHAHTPWTLKEMNQLMDLIAYPEETLDSFFPRGCN